jgi:pyruvate dehydrogenase E2 component (dihydrolipoamide acetyltransferase)
MGLEVSSATVLALLVAVGDTVVADQPLLEVETEKATAEVTAPVAGVIASIDVAEGDEVAVGTTLARIAGEGEATPVGEATPPGDATTPAAPPLARLRAAPVARRAAEAMGVDLRLIAGTGPRGRITLRDVERAATAMPAARDVPGSEALGKVRKITARRMTQSQLIPQYRLERDVDATHLLAMKDAQAKAGVNDLLLQAIAEMLVRHPALAMSYSEDDTLRRHPAIGVGLAVATERGLTVPVVPAVDTLGLGAIAAHRTRLVAAARAGKLAPADLSGAAVTLSNLAGFGVDRFTAMLNPGESAIVAVGRVVERVVPRGRGIAIVPMLTVTVSFDHRAVDGAVGGAALAELADLLEGGMTWRP